jgi:hypothetical protein
MAAFTDASGFPVARIGSGAAFVEFVRDERGHDVELRYRDRDKRPRPDVDGAYGWRMEYNDQGLATRVTLLDEHGKPLRIKAGYAAIAYEHDPLGNATSVQYLDEEGRRARHRLGPSGLRRDFDNFGRLVTETNVDENGQPVPSMYGVVRLKRTYLDRLNFVEEYQDADGRPKPSRYGVTRVREEIVEKTAQKKTVRRTFLDSSDRPVRTSDWSAGEIIVSDRAGLELEHSYLGPDGNLTTHLDGFAREVKQYDDDGNLTQWEAFDAAGKRTRNEHWIARKTLAYDDRGRCTEENYFGPDERLTLCSDRYARKKMTYDSSGNVSTIEYFGLDGKPTRCKDGYSLARFEYDERGHVAMERFFAPNGKPTWHKKGYIALQKQHDARGNLTSRKALAAEDRRVADWTGVHEYRFEYDSWGNKIKELRFNPDSTARLGADGAAGLLFDLDRYGREQEITLLGFRGEPILGRTGYSKERIDRDPAGWPTCRSYVGLDGKLAANKERVARIDYVNDPLGNVLDVRYFGADERPVLHKGFYHRAAYRYNDRSLREEEKFFAADGVTPANGQSGTASALMQHDDRGNLIGTRFFAKDGTPGEHVDGNHQNRRTYDDRGLMIEEAYFGKNGAAINLKETGARITYEYDERGNRTALQTIDALGKPILGPTRFARSVMTYDDRDNRISGRYFGLDGKPCLHAEGNAAVIAEFNDSDQETKHEFLGLDNQLVFIKEYGYARWTAVYDSRGNNTDQQYFDAAGKPINGKDGWARMQTLFDEFNRPLDNGKTIIDQTGKQLQTRVVVDEVIPGGAGSKLGLKAGDIALYYDGAPVLNVVSFIARRDQEKPTDAPRILRVRRGTQELEFSVTPGRLTVNLVDKLVPQ